MTENISSSSALLPLRVFTLSKWTLSLGSFSDALEVNVVRVSLSFSSSKNNTWNSQSFGFGEFSFLYFLFGRTLMFKENRVWLKNLLKSIDVWWKGYVHMRRQVTLVSLKSRILKQVTANFILRLNSLIFGSLSCLVSSYGFRKKFRI